MLHHFKGEINFCDFECRMCRRDGNWRRVRDRGCLSSRSADGKPLWMHDAHEDVGDCKTTCVAKAAPDGYTFFIHHNGMANAPGLYRILPAWA